MKVKSVRDTKPIMKNGYVSLMNRYDGRVMFKGKSVMDTLQVAVKGMCHLQGIDLWGSDLTLVELVGIDGRGLDLRGVDFRDCILVGANMRGARLRGAQFDGADLRHARLGGCIDACFDGAMIDGIDASYDDHPFMQSWYLANSVQKYF